MAVEKYKTKKGVRWMAVIYEGRTKIATKGGFQLKRDALKWEREEKERLESAEKRASLGLSFKTMTGPYLQDCEARFQQNTVREKRTHFERFEYYLENAHRLQDILSSSVTSDVAADFAARIQAGQNNTSANRHVRSLKALWNWHIRRGKLASNPWATVQPYPEDKQVKYVPPSQDIDKVRMAATPWERTVIDLLYFTAARLDEILRLTWEDVNLDQGTLILWTRKRKDGALEPRKLAMSPSLKATLRGLWSKRDPEEPWVIPHPEVGGRMHRNHHAIKYLFNRLCKKAEVKRFTAHCIRHHVASRLQDSGKATSRQVQNFLGHKRLTTTETYLHELDVDRGVAEILELGTNEGTNETEKGVASTHE